MKTFDMKRWAAVALAAAAAFGCDKMTDTQREWIDRGETVYVGRFDSLRVRSGVGRVQIEGDTRYVRTAAVCRVRVGEREYAYDLADIVGDDGRARILIEGLDAGSHYFYVTNYDAEGGRSLTTEVFGRVYGEEDLLLLRPCRAETMTPAPDGSILLGWSDAEGVERLDLEWEAADGSLRRTTVDGRQATRLPSWRRGGVLRTTTSIRQAAEDLDALVLSPVEQRFPDEAEFELDKSRFDLVELPTDTRGNAYAGTSCGARGLWDGVWSPYEDHSYHTADGEGVPHHLTVDLGVRARLSRVWLAGRTDGYVDWNPRRWQLWGRETLDGAETTLPSMDPAWEAEAREKGWMLLGEFTSSDFIYNGFAVEAAADVRYVRFRVTEVFGGGDHTGASGPGAYGCAAELTLWADAIEEVDAIEEADEAGE